MSKSPSGELTCYRKSKFITLSREEWIEEQRRKGLAKKAARSNLRENGSITEANQA